MSGHDGDAWPLWFLVVTVVVILGATAVAALISEGYERLVG